MNNGIIKAVAFDWGGVLINNPVRDLIRYCSRALQVSPEKLEAALQFYEEPLQEGRISESTLCETISKQLGVKFKVSLWKESIRNVFEEIPEMIELVRNLNKNGYKTGLISNTEPSAVDYFNSRGYDFFHTTVFSCNEGVSKPKRKIYQIAIDRLSTRPCETIFVDDNLENVLGARAVGMNGVLFKNPKQIKTELIRFGV